MRGETPLSSFCAEIRIVRAAKVFSPFRRTSLGSPSPSGVAGGVGISLAAHALSISLDGLLLFPPLLGASIGYLAEQARNDRATVANAEDANTALQTLMVEEADARREIHALNERQRESDRAGESAHMSRIDAMQDVLKRAEEMTA